MWVCVLFKSNLTQCVYFNSVDGLIDPVLHNSKQWINDCILSLLPHIPGKITHIPVAACELKNIYVLYMANFKTKQRILRIINVHHYHVVSNSFNTVNMFNSMYKYTVPTSTLYVHAHHIHLFYNRESVHYIWYNSSTTL